MKSKVSYQKTSRSYKFNNRKWWLAFLLSLIIPGLGQIYNGQTRKGILFICIAISLPLLIVSATSLDFPTPFNILLPLFLMFLIPLDAAFQALNSRNINDFKFDIRTLMNTLLLILFAFVVLKLGNRLFFASYWIAGDEMLPTFFKNDFILIEKFSSLKFIKKSSFYKTPTQGDLLFFRYPLDENQHYIKRCIALPGQTVEVRNGAVLIDGKPEGLLTREEGITMLPGMTAPFETFRVKTDSGKSFSILQIPDMVVPVDNYGPVKIPRKGERIVFPLRNEDEWLAYVKLIQFENHTFSRKPGSNEVYIDSEVALDYVVARDYYFVLGDNRDKNQDSRNWGFLASDNIIGRPSIIYFSWRPEVVSKLFWSKIRRGRIGKVVE